MRALPGTADKTQAGVADKPMGGTRTIDRRLADLKSYCRSQGLCDHCSEKWSREHRCAPQVGLHVLEELYALFGTDLAAETADSEETPAEEECLCLSTDSTSASPSAKTLQFHGIMGSVPILLLVDWGSSISFVSQTLVDRLALPTVECPTVQVHVADGNTMQCSQMVPSAEWSIHQCHFQYTMKVLPIHTYDIILGIDWLQLFSPMKINWRHRWLATPYQGTIVKLYGSPRDSVTCSEDLLIQLCTVSDTPLSVDSSIHPAIAQLLSEFPSVTAPPSQLPPKRDCDHSIPLIEGARPVSVRPYRYPPALKDEIEQQVETMLAQGLIQHSTSPFNSPVLLVRKKDASWRFCVDYRYLNALTVKTSFPIPIFEQLMDELAGAQWFTTLDLLAGYHQVRMREGEEYKTAFLTHS